MKAYYNGYKRSGLALVHIVRTTPINRQYRSAWVTGEFKQAWCGVSASESKASPKVEVNAAAPLDEGLWCGPCLGRAAAHAGVLDGVAALLLAKEATK